MCVLGKGVWETASRDFLPPDKNNSDRTLPLLGLHGNPSATLFPAPISAVTLSQLPDAAWPGVAVMIRIAGLMLN